MTNKGLLIIISAPSGNGKDAVIEATKKQVYVKAEDGKQNVGAYLKSVQAGLKIAKIVRFETGEGMEKKNEDFAAEVAKQMNG